MSDLSADQIRSIVQQVLQEERELNAERIDESVLKTVSAILTSFGIEQDERREIQADFAHLRRWRKSVETVGRVGIGAAVTVIVTGLLGALWVGLKVAIGK